MTKKRLYILLPVFFVMLMGTSAAGAATPQVADGDTVKGKTIHLHDGSTYQGESILGLVPNGRGELTREGGERYVG